jgi:hypothetical protein
MSAINVNGGARTDAEPGQKTDLKGEISQTQLTDAQKQQLGAENLGAVLKKFVGREIKIWIRMRSLN